MTKRLPDQGDDNPAFSVQAEIRAPWRNYLDALAPLRPEFYRHCVRLTGNIWDAEDLVQDALLRVFSLLGKVDADLENPKAYLYRTATNLWIDRLRRTARDEAWRESETETETAQASVDLVDQLTAAADAERAAVLLLQKLHPQERAAVVLKDVLDFSLSDTAAQLNTTVGAVKAALHRGRSRLDERISPARFQPPDRVLVERFMLALKEIDLQALQAICARDLTVELVGGAETASFETSKTFFQHAHFVMPEIGFGLNPRWSLIDYQGEPMVLGFRTLDGFEGINEVHRLDVVDGRITRIRCYCFCPDTLAALAEDLGERVLQRPYRSPG